MVEIVAQCPTHFGRYAIGSGKPEELLKWIDARSITKAQADKLDATEVDGKFVLGEFVNIERLVFGGTTSYEAGERNEADKHTFCGFGGQGIVLRRLSSAPRL